MISKMFTIIQLNVVSPPQHLRWDLRAVNLLVSHSQDVYKSLETLSLVQCEMTTVNFSDFDVDKSEILREFQRHTQSFDIRRDVYPRLKKLPQKYCQVSRVDRLYGDTCPYVCPQTGLN